MKSDSKNSSFDKFQALTKKVISTPKKEVEKLTKKVKNGRKKPVT